MLDPETARQIKWHHAMNPKPVQKIANLQMRMASYHLEMRGFLRDLAVMALVEACIVFPFVYFAPTIFSALLSRSVDMDRGPLVWFLAVIMWVGMLVPPFMMMKPKRPTERDVLYDIALRRQVGMDDTVAE